MTYIIQLQYFDKKGYQQTKELSRKTIKGLMSAIKKFDDNNEIYQVGRISYNLVEEKEFNDYINNLGWK